MPFKTIGRTMRRNKPTRIPEKRTEEPVDLAGNRLQKVMAASGLGSRRALEKLIASGDVLVNGKAAVLGQSVTTGDRIRFQDRDWLVSAETGSHRTLIYNKPEGELTTRSDPDGRPTVFDHLPWIAEARWVAVGRLDVNTTGLLLLTTDGELANALMHPSNLVDREYVCRIRGVVSDEQLEQLREGVLLEDGPARFSDVQRMAADGTAGNQWFQITILEGRNREVRRLWEAVGCMVSRLKRVRYGAATLPKGLRVGKFSEVTPRDHRVLRQDVKLATAADRLILQEVKNLGRPSRPKNRQMPTGRKRESSPDRRARPEHRARSRSGEQRAREAPTDRDGPWRSADRPGSRSGDQRTRQAPTGRDRPDRSADKPQWRPGDQRARQVPSDRPARPTDRPRSRSGDQRPGDRRSEDRRAREAPDERPVQPAKKKRGLYSGGKPARGSAADRGEPATGKTRPTSGAERHRGPANDRPPRPAGKPLSRTETLHVRSKVREEPVNRPTRPSSKPGSPAGAGRRPHPRSRKTQRG